MQKKNPIYGGFFKGGAELFALFLFYAPLILFFYVWVWTEILKKQIYLWILYAITSFLQ